MPCRYSSTFMYGFVRKTNFSNFFGYFVKYFELYYSKKKKASQEKVYSFQKFSPLVTNFEILLIVFVIWPVNGGEKGENKPCKFDISKRTFWYLNFNYSV